MKAWSGKGMTAAALLALAAVAPSRLSAQGVTTGAISGFVQDSAGAPLGGAAVEVRYAATGFRGSAITNTRGFYLIQGLEPGGPYTVTARAIGYRAERAEGLRVGLGQATRHDFRLVSSPVQVEDIVVQTVGEEEIFSPSNQGTSTTIADSALRRLPTLNRDFADFVKLTPQVGIRDGDEGGIAVAGQNNRFNTVQVDGATVNDRFGLGRTGQTGGQAGGRAVGLDAVKEYQVLLAPYDVRQGNFVGALINAVTKSGTNDFAGTAFFYNRGDALAGDPLGQTEFNQSQFGATFGGPIARDKAHFFLAGETSRRTAPATGPYFGSVDNPPIVSEADYNRFLSILEAYGLEAGNGDLFDRSNPLVNLLARFDWQLSSANRLVFRYGYNTANDDVFSRSTAQNNPIFDLTTFAYQFRNKTHNPSLQLFTNFAGGSSNEFRLSFQRIRDRRTPAVTQPLVLVENLTTASGTGTARIQAGSDAFSQGNELDQDYWELTNNFTMPMGNHLITLGTRNEYYDVRNLFAQNSFGVWTFSNLDNFENGVPRLYNAAGSVGGGVPGETPFKAYTLGFYAQDQWTVNERFSATFGLRADVPIFPDEVEYDPRVATLFGEHDVPSGQIMWQPRLGFNYAIAENGLSQLRGGAGIFAGAPAFVWMSNAYANNGLRLNQLACSGANAPDFVATLPTPLTCRDGTTIGPGRSVGEIDLIGEDTKFPSVLRFNLGIDHQLPAGIVGTLEGIYTKGLNDYFIVNRNLSGPVGVDAVGRTMYGTIPTTGISAPAHVDAAAFGIPSANGGVYELLNTDKNYSWSISGQLRKSFFGSTLLSAAYTYSHAKDVQSFTSSRAISNWRNSRTYYTTQDEEIATVGSFNRPHRIVIGASYTAPWKRFATDISLTYVGQSGQPYTYIGAGAGNRGDLNADGTNTNDPIYIPTGPTDPNLQFRDITGTGGVVVVSAADQATAFDQFISEESCLDRQRGQIMWRNSCTNPWQSFLDMSIRQSLPTVGGRPVTLEIGVFNLLNLLNSDWGQIRTVGGTVFYQEDPLQFVGATATGTPIVTFDPANLENRFISNGSLVNSYQVQIGLRYAF